MLEEVLLMQATHAFLRMLPLFWLILMLFLYALSHNFPFHKAISLNFQQDMRFITLYTPVSHFFASDIMRRSIMMSRKARRFRAIFVRTFLKIHVFMPRPERSAGAFSNRIVPPVRLSVRLSVIPSRLQSDIFKVWIVIQ